MRQATIRATITDTTPSIVTALLTRASDDPATQAAATPATSTDTSPAPLQGSGRLAGWSSSGRRS